MSSRINTYQDLIVEKHRLEALLKAQRELIRADVQELKQELAPVQNAIKFVGKLAKRDMSNPIMTSLSDTAIDLVLRKGLLARAGWLTKLAIPFVTKNLSSHFLSDNKEALFSKIVGWFTKGTKHSQNGQADQPMAEEREEEDAVK
ncbi:MAG: hypothetical protein NVV59_06885 [Chitinophagaceae bacterium]|nr:hypothetical protein [Chitinophagaceae bacterium]